MTRKLLFLICGLLAAGHACAQAYKCVDARGKVTYTSTPCEEFGQRGDTVRDRMNTSPAQRAERPVAPRVAPPPAPPEAETAKSKPDGAAAQPERRCFTTKTGTRCNDTPE